MNKQELIDKAVEDLKGALGGVDWHGATGYDILIKLLSGEYSMAHTDSMAAKGESDNEVICGTSKFTKRARELGWVNGYKWGEEYPTNGKKPDLPDDVLVKTVDLRGTVRTEKVGFFTWEWYESFIMVDQRYKPVEVEQLEPVNTLLEMLDNLNDEELYEVGQSKEAKSLVELLLKRKADEEKRAFVEAAFKALYDAGCRFK